MITLLGVSLNVNVMKSEWTSPLEPTYPFSDGKMAAAYHDDIIFILGGNSHLELWRRLQNIILLTIPSNN